MRPTAMIMEDEYFGKRNHKTGLPRDVDKTELTEWDFAIIRAYETIEAYTDKNGIFQWHKEDPEERIDAKKKIDPFQAGVDRITRNEKYKPAPGEYFVPDIKSGRPGGKMWTFMDWRNAEVKRLMEENAQQQRMVE